MLESKGHQKSILAVRLHTRKDNTQSLGILVREHCHVIPCQKMNRAHIGEVQRASSHFLEES